MQLPEIKAMMANDLAAVDDEIRRQLHSDVPLIDQVSHYIINSGGKRLRPRRGCFAAAVATPQHVVTGCL